MSDTLSPFQRITELSVLYADGTTDQSVIANGVVSASVDWLTQKLTEPLTADHWAQLVWALQRVVTLIGKEGRSNG